MLYFFLYLKKSGYSTVLTFFLFPIQYQNPFMVTLALDTVFPCRFHNSANEPCLEHAVVPCLRDDVQLSVDIYRNKLYELIASRKSRLKTSSSTSNINAKATMQQSNHNNSSSSSQSKRNNQNVLSNSQNISPARAGGGGGGGGGGGTITQTNSQPIKVKVVARKLERHPAPRAEEFCVRQSSKDSDKSSAKSSAKSSSSSSPASNGRRKSLSPVTTQQQQQEKRSKIVFSFIRLSKIPSHSVACFK